MLNEIYLPRALINRLLHQAQSSPDSEICGFIGARNGKPSTCYAVRNIAEHPAVRFQMDPSEQIDALRTMRESQEELFAIYHSHPSASAELSATDLEQLSYPETLQIVISLNTKGVLEMRGFQVRAKSRIEEIPLVID